MPSANVYPDLPAIGRFNLDAVRMAATGREDYLDHEDCPYDEPTKELLRAWLAPATATVPNMLAGLDEREAVDLLLDEVEHEVSRISTMARQMDAASVDMTAKIQFSRVRNVSLEKWMAIKDGLIGMRSVMAFKAAVVEVMERFVGADDRQAVIEALKSATGK